MATDQSRWKYVLTALDGSTPSGAGEVPHPSSRTYDDPLNGMRQAGFAVDMDNPRLPWLLNNDALCNVYRLNRLGNWDWLIQGDVISTEEKKEGDNGSVTVTVADPFWRVGKRLLGTAVNSQGQGTGFTVGTPSVPVDLSVIVSLMLQSINSDFWTGVTPGTVTNCGTTSVVGPIYSDFAGPNIQQLCALLGGPDFWIVPTVALGSGSMPYTTIGQMNIQFARGQIRPNAIFEYGAGKKNVQSYNRLLTKQDVANHVIALPIGWPSSVNNGDPIAVSDDSTSQNTRSRFDDVASSDVVSYQLRNLLCQEEVAVRKTSRQQITFVPTVENPMDYRVDYDTGDVVTARAYDQSSQTFRFNGTVRVYGVNITISDEDQESISLTLVPS